MFCTTAIPVERILVMLLISQTVYRGQIPGTVSFFVIGISRSLIWGNMEIHYEQRRVSHVNDISFEKCIKLIVNGSRHYQCCVNTCRCGNSKQIIVCANFYKINHCIEQSCNQTINEYVFLKNLL